MAPSKNPNLEKAVRDSFAAQPMMAGGRSACGYAAFSLMPEGSGVLTIEYKINLLAPAKDEELIARARVIRTAARSRYAGQKVRCWTTARRPRSQ